MGQKIHPYGFRVGITRPWRSRWYANKHKFGALLIEDHRIRQHIMQNYSESAIPRVEIERKGEEKVTVFIHTAKAGTLLGKKTNRLTELEKELHELTGGKVIDTRLIDIQKPELDATLTAQRIAEQIVRRINFRRAAKREQELVQQSGALGIKIQLAGRLGGKELARTEKMVWGSIPLHTLRADVDYGIAEAHTTYGTIGIQIWINRGEIQMEPAAEAAQTPANREGGRQWR
ncbi:MAG: 30S ribosomal protein S3 [Planctomycetes bacterium]|nr:30S ribosomal protein S3 [Planctomycetota bacterium]NUQ35614.1 30S ribosomal protein S3 [Planctomycetaceae bacterium]